jgi:hypothetical protein
MINPTAVKKNSRRRATARFGELELLGLGIGGGGTGG